MVYLDGVLVLDHGVSCEITYSLMFSNPWSTILLTDCTLKSSLIACCIVSSFGFTCSGCMGSDCFAIRDVRFVFFFSILARRSSVMVIFGDRVDGCGVGSVNQDIL